MSASVNFDGDMYNNASMTKPYRNVHGLVGRTVWVAAFAQHANQVGS